MLSCTLLDLGEVQSYVEFPNRCKVRNGLMAVETPHN